MLGNMVQVVEVLEQQVQEKKKLLCHLEVLVFKMIYQEVIYIMLAAVEEVLLMVELLEQVEQVVAAMLELLEDKMRVKLERQIQVVVVVVLQLQAQV